MRSWQFGNLVLKAIGYLSIATKQHEFFVIQWLGPAVNLTEAQSFVHRINACYLGFLRILYIINEPYRLFRIVISQ